MVCGVVCGTTCNTLVCNNNECFIDTIDTIHRQERERREEEDMVLLSSASGVLALLEEHDHNIKHHALQHLDQLVHSHWAEIASAIDKMYTPHSLYHSLNYHNALYTHILVQNIHSFCIPLFSKT